MATRTSKPKVTFRRVVAIAVPLALSCFLPFLLPTGDDRYLFEQSAGVMIDSTLAWTARQPEFANVESLPVILLEKAHVMREDDLPAPFRLAIRDRFARFMQKHGKSVEWLPAPTPPPLVSLVMHPELGRIRGVASWFPPRGEPRRLERIQPFYRRWALLPPLVAIVLALTTRRALLSLGIGALLGAMLVGVQEAAMVPLPAGATSFLNPLAGAWRLLYDYFWQRSLRDQFRIEVLGFVAALMAAVGVMTRGGGVSGMVDLVVRRAKSVVQTRLVAAIMGFVIFFDDYTNCIVVGNTMRPLTDRRWISREKLSLIVDTTAAPVAGIMLLSTWVAYQVSMFAPQLQAVGVTDDAYAIFLRAFPYRFYCLFVLFLLFASILLRRDLGPMVAAERRAGSTGNVIRDGGTPLAGSRAMTMSEKPGVPRRWQYALIPFLVMPIVSIGEMLRIGLANVEGPVQLGQLADLRRVLAATRTTEALFHGSIAMWVVASILMLAGCILTWRDVLGASVRAASGVLFAIAILFLAWAIGGVTSDLGTAHVLVAFFKGSMPPAVLPILLFLISCAISFATGTSWGTMAIVLPNTVVLAYTLGANFAGGALALTIISIAAVLEGSIFGDHCSPISDTTLLSSMSSGSDHMDHTRTQLPYALLAMGVALVAGYVPVVLGVHPVLALAAGAAAILAFLFLWGRDPDRGRNPASGP